MKSPQPGQPLCPQCGGERQQPKATGVIGSSPMTIRKTYCANEFHSARPGQPLDERPMSVQYFRKKPIIIQAMKFDGSDESATAIEAWGGPQHVTPYKDHLNIYTLEGIHKASIGDWIIKGVKGEFYPIKPDILAETYDPVARESEQPKYHHAPCRTCGNHCYESLVDGQCQSCRSQSAQPAEPRVGQITDSPSALQAASVENVPRMAEAERLRKVIQTNDSLSKIYAIANERDQWRTVAEAAYSLFKGQPSLAEVQKFEKTVEQLRSGSPPVSTTVTPPTEE